MKKITKFLLTALALCAVAFTGCDNAVSSQIASSNTNATYTGTDRSEIKYKTVTLSVTGDPAYVSFPIADSEDNNEDARTIVADSLTATTLKYYIHYKNIKTGGWTYNKAPLEFKANSLTTPNIGTVPLTLEDGQYEFTLYAVQASASITLDGSSGDVTTLASNATLIGKTSADLRSRTERVHFYMSPDGLSGNANLKLKVYTDQWKVSDYNTATNTYLTSYSVIDVATGTAVSLMDGVAITLPDDQNIPTQPNIETTSGIPAGTYSLVISFSNTIKTYEWSDLIVIMPNNDIVTEVKIPDIIEKLPDAPTNLYVAFKDCTNNEQEYYNVAFNWTDNSNNETYFQLELAEVGAQASPFASATNPIGATTTDWGTLTQSTSYFQKNLRCSITSITTYGEDLYGKQDVWVLGSLLKNNNQAIIKIPLEKRYVARICAVNAAGKSAYAYMDFTGAVTLTDENGVSVTGYSKFAANAKTINRYRINYFLNGGTLTYTAAAGGTTVTDTITEYRTQNDATNAAQGTYDPTPAVVAGTYVANEISSGIDVPSADIMNPTCDTTTIDSLIKGNNPWTYWKKDKINGICYNNTRLNDPIPDAYEPNDYTDYKNLNLFGCYNAGKADVTVYDPNLHNITAANVSVAGNGVTNNITAENAAVLDLNSTGAGVVNWTVSYITAQTNENITWDKINVKIRRQGTSYDLYSQDMIKGASNFSVQTDLSVFSTGKYAVTFSAYNSTSQLSNIVKPYQYTVYLSIVENVVAGAVAQHKVDWTNPSGRTITATANGSPVSKGSLINDGTEVEFTLSSPADGKGVVSWTGATIDTTQAGALVAKTTISADTNITVTLDTAYAITFDIAAGSTGSISATALGCALTSGNSVAKGVTVTFTSTGGTGAIWTGTDNTSVNTRTNTLNVTGATTVEATAASKVTFAKAGAATGISAQDSNNNSVTSDSYVKVGETVTITATGATTYEWKNDSDGTTVSSTATYAPTVGSTDIAVTCTGA